MSPWILQVQVYLFTAKRFALEPGTKLSIFFRFFTKVSSVTGRVSRLWGQWHGFLMCYSLPPLLNSRSARFCLGSWVWCISWLHLYALSWSSAYFKLVSQVGILGPLGRACSFVSTEESTAAGRGYDTWWRYSMWRPRLWFGVVLPAYGCSFSPAELLVLLGKPAELDYQSSPRRQ